jgi:hypothetical protein
MLLPGACQYTAAFACKDYSSGTACYDLVPLSPSTFLATLYVLIGANGGANILYGLKSGPEVGDYRPCHVYILLLWSHLSSLINCFESNLSARPFSLQHAAVAKEHDR